jgi:acyl-CoA thioester hydrolase
VRAVGSAAVSRTHVHRERVRFGDLDAMRHLNNVVFLRYFETARIAFLRELSPAHDPARPEADPAGLIFAECHIRYRSPVRFDELVDIECSVGEVRRSAFEMLFAMRVGERLAAEGSGWLVGFDYVAQRAAPLTEALRAALSEAAG